jgi:hypothetical protein
VIGVEDPELEGLSSKECDERLRARERARMVAALQVAQTSM